MRPSLYQWLIGIALAFGVHALALASLKNGEPVKIERASSQLISIAGSLSDYASEAETIVQDSAEIVEPEDLAQEIEPEEIANEPLESDAATLVPVEEPKTAKRKKKKKKKRAEPKKRKAKAKPKTRRAHRGTTGRQGGGGGNRQSRHAGTADMSNFKGRVRARIARRVRSARGRGTVVVRFTVTASGGVTKVRIIRSSNSALNNAALRAVRGGFPTIPANLPRKLTFTVPIAFK